MNSCRISPHRRLPSHVGRSLAVLMMAVALCSCRTPLEMQPNGAGWQAERQTLPQTASPNTAAAARGVTDRAAGAVVPAQHVADAPCPAPHAAVYRSLPPDAFTGRPFDGSTVPGLPGNELVGQDPCCPGRSWSPPGIARPWPLDEYLCDGGDRYVPTRVSRDYEVHGLDSEDTVVHYDTVDGRRVVQPSNRVCIYAPRFGAIRRVTAALQHDQQDRIARYDQPIQAFRSDDLQKVVTAIQPLQPVGEMGTKSPTIFQRDVRGQAVDAGQALAGFSDTFLPYENMEIIKTGRVDHADKPRLAQAIDAAHVWTHEQAVQLTIDRQPAHEIGGDSKPQTTYEFVLPDGKQRVRIIKIASKQNALPGETIDFTLRFDNVGDQPVENVTVIDNLTSRLEYEPDTAQCSVEADFFTEENEGQSLVLRWEIVEPLQVGEGGIIRFKCRVR
jgi:uncharacterized repeat protein (TIGR01451 family)